MRASNTATAPVVDVDAVLGRARPSIADVLSLRAACLTDAASRRAAAAHLEGAGAASGLTGAAALAAGICQFALGRSGDAVDLLSRAGQSSTARYLHGVALSESDRPSHGADVLKALVESESDRETLAATIEALLRAGRVDEARAMLPKGKDGGLLGDDARARYLRAFCDDLSGRMDDALNGYDMALKADGAHAPTLLRLGFLADLHGDDESALDYYRRAASATPPSVNALLNLGALHEDRGEFSRAGACYRRVLESDPNNLRARMFLRDSEASLHMFYDEDMERKDDRRVAVMRTPITDFELSVRSRNCLAKMGVQSLGDLIRYTEQELLSHKNFGETSLQEIKDILAQKALRLGMDRNQDDDATRAFLGAAPPPLVDDRDAMLRRPITELELSVRARNCMATLGVQTIGDLVAQSELDLMACKNFGQTSMNEIRQKLAEFGLMLRAEED
jgi:DNA-directed RNA polymerase subunit alpha